MWFDWLLVNYWLLGCSLLVVTCWLFLVWSLIVGWLLFSQPPRYRVTNEWPVVWCEEKAGKAKSESKGPRLDGHQQPFQKGHVFTIPKRSQRIARKAHYELR